MAGAGLTILNFPVFGKNAPSNKVVLAVMGVNSRGSYLAKSYLHHYKMLKWLIYAMWKQRQFKMVWML